MENKKIPLKKFKYYRWLSKEISIVTAKPFSLNCLTFTLNTFFLQMIDSKKLLVYTDELLKLQKALILNNIQAIYLKGVIQYFALTNKWPSKKIPIDIDTLIPPDSFSQVNRVLESLGYLVHLPYKSPAVRPQTSFVKTHALMPIVCDVHNQIFFRRNIFLMFFRQN